MTQQEDIALNYDSTNRPGERRDSRFSYVDAQPNRRLAEIGQSLIQPLSQEEAILDWVYDIDKPPILDLDSKLSADTPLAKSILQTKAALRVVDADEDRPVPGERCRCGKLADEPAPGCKWHEARAQAELDEPLIVVNESPLQVVPLSSVPIDEVIVFDLNAAEPMVRPTTPVKDNAEAIQAAVDAYDSWDDVTPGCQIQVDYDDVTRIGIADHLSGGFWYTAGEHRLGGSEGNYIYRVRILARPQPIADWTVVEVLQVGAAFPVRLIKHPDGWHDLAGQMVIPDGQRFDFESVTFLSRPEEAEEGEGD